MKQFIFDFETTGSAPRPIILELSAVVFDTEDPEEDFEKLIADGIKIKFNIQEQKDLGRYTEPETIEFWKKQPQELVTEMFRQGDDCLTLREGIYEFLSYLKRHRLNPWKTIGWCRGQSFDFPILVGALREVFNVVETGKYEPVKYWRQRDIRTYVSAAMNNIEKANIPLLKTEIPGFIHHDSIHDCAKDVIMIKKAMRMLNGEEMDFPNDPELYEPTTL